MDLTIWDFLTNARRGAMRSKTQWVFYRDLEWWPGPQKVQFWKTNGYPEVVGLILALLRENSHFYLFWTKSFFIFHMKSTFLSNKPKEGYRLVSLIKFSFFFLSYLELQIVCSYFLKHGSAHCLDWNLNDQKTRHYFWQWSCTYKNK